eukprot:scaffold4740_cov59-Phaeocystis_antarctica.AAC.6
MSTSHREKRDTTYTYFPVVARGDTETGSARDARFVQRIRDGRCLEHARTRTPRVRARARACVKKKAGTAGQSEHIRRLAEAVGETWGGPGLDRAAPGCAVLGLWEGELAELGE